MGTTANESYTICKRLDLFRATSWRLKLIRGFRESDSASREVSESLWERILAFVIARSQVASVRFSNQNRRSNGSDRNPLAAS
jgi:hypothetical protein